MESSGGFFSVEMTIVVALIIITVLTVLVMFTNATNRLNYTLDNEEYEKAFSLKIKEIRMQKIMREFR